jgi:hypothetical protein
MQIIKQIIISVEEKYRKEFWREVADLLIQDCDWRR